MPTIIGLRNIYPYFILFVAGMLITIPIVVGTAGDRRTDFSKHYHYAQQMPDEVHVAHVLYYASVLAVEYVMPTASIAAVNFVSMTIFMAPLPALVFFLLKRNGLGYVGERSLIAAIALPLHHSRLSLCLQAAGILSGMSALRCGTAQPITPYASSYCQFRSWRFAL